MLSFMAVYCYSLQSLTVVVHCLDYKLGMGSLELSLASLLLNEQ